MSTTTCPYCGAESMSCGTLLSWIKPDQTQAVFRPEKCRNREALRLLDRYNHPGCEPGAHALANKLRQILTGEVRSYA